MTATLPDAEWRHWPGVTRVLTALGGPDQTLVVGGAVRDTLEGLAVADVDFATRLTPDAVTARLEAAGIKAVPTGIAHGTITAVADGRPYEVTTLRRDVATDGRRATVAFTDDWAEDAARRDFTINALYADPVAGTIFDPTGGIDDLAARRVRFIGDAGARIDEDHLRILRWFRFLARFGDALPDTETLALVTSRAAQLRGLSRERVASELLLILALPDPAPTVRLMAGAGVLAVIGPEMDGNGIVTLAQLIANEAATATPPDAMRRLIALLPADAAAAERFAARLKLSNRQKKRIAASRQPCTETDPRTIAYRVGMEAAYDRILTGPAAGLTALATLENWTPPRLPISGGDLIAMGMAPGPDVARMLRQVEDQWAEAGFPDAKSARAIAAHLLAQ
jgi:poly(A) polymerase